MDDISIDRPQWNTRLSFPRLQRFTLKLLLGWYTSGNLSANQPSRLVVDMIESCFAERPSRSMGVVELHYVDVGLCVDLPLDSDEWDCVSSQEDVVRLRCLTKAKSDS